MRSLRLLDLIFLAILALSSHSFRIAPQGFFVSGRNLLPTDRISTNLKRNNNILNPQRPIMPEDPPHTSIHPSGPDGSSGATLHDSGGGEGDRIVSDILNKERDVNAFASLARQIKSVSTRLNDGTKNTTVLAPTNAVLQHLPRKPWESPRDYDAFGQEDAYAGQQGRDRAAENLKRFVETHVIPDSPWSESTEAETLGGVKISWVKGENGKFYIHPGNVEVDRVATQVSNGEVWILNGIVNY